MADLPSARGAPIGIKFLADAAEVQCIMAQDIGLVQLQLQANARIVISDAVFPGCFGLQEVRVLAESAKSLLTAMIMVLTKVTKITGKLSCGEHSVDSKNWACRIL